MTIITECPTCDHPAMLGWEGGKHGWFPAMCEQCKSVMWVEATRIGGETLNSLEFFARIVKPEDQERVRASERRFIAECETKKAGWMEIDCPVCGIDHDVALDATHCGCGAPISPETLADANRYDADGNCINESPTA
jgi:hypothetical protein